MVAGGVVVCLLGPLAALGIYGVRKYIAAAKTAEAKNGVNAISRAAVAAYERDTLVGDRVAHLLCASATPVPGVIPKGRRYQPSSARGTDFQTGDANGGWYCLRFEMSEPMSYQYRYERGAGTGKSGATANGFEASARGDLDADGVSSLFARGGNVVAGAVVMSTNLYIENEFE
jgi:type IV pilus assembly protein PilA